MFAQLSNQAKIEESIKAPFDWPLYREFTGDSDVKKANNAKNVSI